MSRQRHEITPWIGLTILLTLFAVNGFFYRDAGDFSMFYASGAAWRTGENPYTAHVPNLQPPIVVHLVFAPLAALPYRAAQIVWLLLSAIACAAAWRLVIRALDLSRARAERVVALVMALYPVLVIWWQGQTIWLLCYPFTQAWLALREGRERAAGWWLVPVILVKPQFALLALVLPWRVWLTAGLASATATAGSVLWTGLEPWRAWLSLSNTVRWLSFADNASLWGLLTRIHDGSIVAGTMLDVAWPWRVGVGLVALVGAVAILRTRDVDLKLARALVWVMLISPLGWICYLPLGLGPLLATWTWTPLTVLALAIWVAPIPFVWPIIPAPWAVPFGSLSCLSLLCWSVGTAHAKISQSTISTRQSKSSRSTVGSEPSLPISEA